MKSAPREQHPYGEFVPKDARAMIVGSFPIGKFSDPKRRTEIKPHELDFFFGGEKNLLWRLLGEVFHRRTSSRSEVQSLLSDQRLAVGDVIRSCRRVAGGASDSDLYDIEWNTGLIDVIRENRIQKVFFTSRKVESWFNRLFHETADIQKISLISPSAQSVRSVSRHPDYVAWLEKNPTAKKYEFILHHYKSKFDSVA